MPWRFVRVSIEIFSGGCFIVDVGSFTWWLQLWHITWLVVSCSDSFLNHSVGWGCWSRIPFNAINFSVFVIFLPCIPGWFDFLDSVFFVFDLVVDKASTGCCDCLKYIRSYRFLKTWRINSHYFIWWIDVFFINGHILFEIRWVVSGSWNFVCVGLNGSCHFGVTGRA